MLAKKPLGSGNRGFTIIEVLVVLAVAGMIMLIIFEAIPTLSRNGRNNQRKQDVATILEAVSHYELNNSANFPPTGTPDFLSTVTLSYYDYTTDVHINPPYGGATPSAVTDTNTVNVYASFKCVDGSTVTAQGADYRNAVALYAVESGSSSSTPQCQQL